ncbi:hypothetical protein CROQUDRAFT_650582 [Cronartium quercuum f. sp. fusiforme G11]|uniref:Uncharacterized protein n=1 Tax=Cronartium quercuum f. sp. fusiforme G11 TaxID=708437 RepID=A0A9P6NX74_9BASI|nr:hypothetical protein CROQUDRAFT_650582 [Cronartium quercuum f. sp. fusiforme G11]
MWASPALDSMFNAQITTPACQFHQASTWSTTSLHLQSHVALPIGSTILACHPIAGLW